MAAAIEGWTMSQEYVHVSELIAKTKDWALHFLINGETPDEKIRLLEDIFRSAVDRHDDKMASSYLYFLFQAIDDEKLVPVTKKEIRASGSTRLLLENSDEARRIQADAARNKAQKAMDLYLSLPKKEERDVYVRDEDSGKYEKHLFSTLIETKKMLLTEVATQWHATKDEQEADCLFNFLVNITKGRYFSDEEKIHESVVRNVTDHFFPLPRLTRHLLAYLRSEGHHTEIAKILAIAWMRNLELKKLAQYLPIFGTLLDSSDSAISFVSQWATLVAPLDTAVKKLLSQMQPEFGERAPEGFGRISGEIQLKYIRQIEIVIEIRIELREWRDSHRTGGFDDAWGHKAFEDARAHVEKFVREYPGMVVHLTLRSVDKYNLEAEPRFKRNQTLSSS